MLIFYDMGKEYKLQRVHNKAIHSNDAIEAETTSLKLYCRTLKLNPETIFPNIDSLDINFKGGSIYSTVIINPHLLPIIFPNLCSLRFGHIRNIDEVSPIFGDFPKLKNLSLERISSWPFKDAIPKKLDILTIVSTTFKEIPNNIAEFEKLRLLHLEDTKLKVISENIGQLPNLQTMVVLKSSQLTLPAISNIKTLSSIRIEGKKGEKHIGIDEEIFKCKNLTSLVISNRNVDKSLTQISKLDKLTGISISNCDLKHIPHEISSLESISSLTFYGNQLSSLPNELRLNKSLRRLHIGNNPISTLIFREGDFPNLETIAIYQTKIKDLSLSFLLLKNLKTISLSTESIGQFPFNILLFVNQGIKVSGYENNHFYKKLKKDLETIGVEDINEIMSLENLFKDKWKNVSYSVKLYTKLSNTNITKLYNSTIKSLLYKIRGEENKLSLNTNNKFYICGTRKSNHPLLEEIIKKNNIEFVNNSKEADSLIICKDITIQEIKNCLQNPERVCSEKEFTLFLLKNSPPYLTTNYNSEDNIRMLLNSKISSSELTVIGSLYEGGIPKNLKTKLIIWYLKYSNNPSIAKLIYNICDLHLSEKEFEIAEFLWGNYLPNYATQQFFTLRKLSKLCEDSDYNYFSFLEFIEENEQLIPLKT